MSLLRRGDLLPHVRIAPPGPAARRLCAQLERCEAPGVNTLPAAGDTLLWQEACGANVLDVDGNRYLDLTAGFGVAAVGHRHPRVVAAVRRQSARLVHGLGDVYAHPLRPQLAAALLARVPVEDGVVYWAVSGADAVEIALKTALLATGRPGVLVFDPAYHGLTLGALGATSRPAFRAPFAPWLQPHLHRLPFGAEPAQIDALLAAAAPAVGCVLVEPVAGREGVLLPPPGWLAGLAELCHRHGALLAADEIFTGFGRTGRWFAADGEGVRPDLLCCGKALGGGLPIAAVIGRRAVMAAWRTAGEALHTATFIAHPLACAAALATLEVLAEERLAERAAQLDPALAARLASWQQRFPAAIAAVRGRGLLWGVELAAAVVAGRWVAAARQRGVLILAGGPQGRVVQLVPPLTILETQLEAALALLEEALAEAAGRDA